MGSIRTVARLCHAVAEFIAAHSDAAAFVARKLGELFHQEADHREEKEEKATEDRRRRGHGQ